MWQCAIQMPGLVTSSRMSTVSPVRTSTVSFQTRLGSTTAVAAQDEEATRAVDVERVVHRMVGVHLVDEPDLHLVADPEPPVDRVVLGARAGRPVDELPAHVRRRRHPVDLDHVVFPLDAAGGVVLVAFAVVLVLAVSAWRPPSRSTSCDGSSFIPHSGQRSGVLADDLGVHRAGVA